MSRKPTEKQTKAVAYLAANPDSSLAEAMRDANYAPNTIKNPGPNFVERSGTKNVVEAFRELAGSRLDNERIVSKIEELLEAQKWVNSYTEPDKTAPDYQARAKGIEFSLKVRGLYQDPPSQTNVQVNFGERTQKERDEFGL